MSNAETYTKDEEDFALERGCTLPQARDILSRRTPDGGDDVPKPRPAVWGDNSQAQVTTPASVTLTGAAQEKLKQVIAKIEKLEEEKKEVAEQIKDVYAEAKSMGYDTKALRGVIRFRKQDRQEREEQQAILDTYLIAVGEMDHYD